MLTLPPVPPSTGWATAVRLPRDHHVRLDSNHYSVHPQVIGRKVLVRADLDTVRICCDGQPAATHPRCWADHQSVIDTENACAATRMRAGRRLAATVDDSGVANLDLTDYDRITATGEVAASWPQNVRPRAVS